MHTHIHQTKSHTDSFSHFFPPLAPLFCSHIFLDCGFFSHENTDCCHRDGHESWQGQALAENLHLISLILWQKTARTGVAERQTEKRQTGVWEWGWAVGGVRGMKGANESNLTDSVWTVGSPAPQGAEFKACSEVIRTNLSSDEREETEMKGKEQLRLNSNLGEGEQRHHVFSSPPSLPMERNALAEWQKKELRGHSSIFPYSTSTMLPSQAGSSDYTTVQISLIKPRSKETGCSCRGHQLTIKTCQTVWFNFIQGLSDVHEICTFARWTSR